MRVSIAMATYNGQRHLREQLESLAGQSFPPLELCVGDDASSDDTVAIIRDFAKTAPFPVRLHVNRERLGYADNFISTAQRCEGDWIAFCDQDDVWLSHKLEVCVECIEQSPDSLVLVSHGARIVDERLRPTGGLMPDNPADSLSEPLQRSLFWSHLGCALVFKASLISEFDQSDRLPTFFTNVARYPHDSWIAGLANVVGSIAEIPDPLMLYRRHEHTASLAGKTEKPKALAAAAGIGADHYEWMADICEQSTECLSRQAKGSAKHRAQLEAGARAFRDLGQAYKMRAAIYRGGSRFRRFRNIVALARSGYRGLGASSFGWKSMAKDVAVAARGG